MTAPGEHSGEPAEILLVEDDRETRLLLESALVEAGYRVTSVGRAAAATASLRKAVPEAVVLDVGLPDGDGVSLCRQWRGAGITAPILILTARTDVSSRVAGLDAGADDYLGKPFALSELRARLRALLRRGAASPRERVYLSGEVRVDFGRRLAMRGGKEVPVTRREFEVLERLARAKGHAVSREILLEEIWGDATAGAGASLEVIVARLRRKLDTAGSETLIRTLRGHGYSLAPAETGGAERS